MNEIIHGPKLNPSEVKAFVRKLLFEDQREIPPVCIWGQHGIGKSELIQEMAQEWGWPMVYFSPAQFEEMGDLTGMPYLKEEGNDVKKSHFAPPAWVPKEEGPGILLIDDFNRADDRILRGMMPLLLQKALVSWGLPEKWVIILTANPDGADYSVTPADDALLSRMIHLNMVFDAPSWARWAEYQQLPGDGIGFVLAHPELITGQRTTPRTLAWFFQLWQQAGLPKVGTPFLRQLAHSCLDAPVADAFIQYLELNDVPLPEPMAILNGSVNVQEMLQNLQKDGIVRSDRINLLCTRLVNHLSRQDQELDPKPLQYLENFLLTDGLPPEQVLLFIRALSANKHPVLSQLMGNVRLAELVIY